MAVVMISPFCLRRYGRGLGAVRAGPGRPSEPDGGDPPGVRRELTCRNVLNLGR